MNSKIKSILLSVIAVLIVVVGYIVFPDMGGVPGDTIADTVGIWDTDNAIIGGGDESEELPSQTETDTPTETEDAGVKEDGEYLSKDDVALYIHKFGKLPKNFITKEEAEDLGWVSSEGNLWDVLPGFAIGGDYFGNYEGLLPKANRRKYYECDVNFEGGYRTDERIVFSNDGLIFYTSDHYETFTELYGE